MRLPVAALGLGVASLGMGLVLLAPAGPRETPPSTPTPERPEVRLDPRPIHISTPSEPTDRPVVSAPLPPRADGRARLAVLIVFDQMRADYLERWYDLYDTGGLRRLTDEGAWFRNCHYPYAHTLTGPGHASLGTGCSPWVHGIVGNNWYEYRTGKLVYCTNDPRAVAMEDDPKKRKGRSPGQLLTDTLGDVLKEATGGKARVVSLSLKDRSAILMAGRRTDHLVLWHDTKSAPGPGSNLGRFVTDRDYYRTRRDSREWLAAFNDRKVKEMNALWNEKKQWLRLREDPLLYELGSGPDDVSFEGEGAQKQQGRSFPHPLRWDVDAKTKKPRTGPDGLFYGTIHNSPFGNELLLDLAKEAIDHEQLGRGEVPDLLCVSFSSNDLIGHCWGPDSQEVLDVTLRSDRVVKALLAHLDAHVGKGNYVVCLSADHGVCPLPGLLKARGRSGDYVSPEKLFKDARAFLQAEYPQGDEAGPCLLGEKSPSQFDGWLTLEPTWLAAKKLDRGAVAEKLAAWLRRQPHVQTAYTRADLLGDAAGDPVRERMRRSFHPERRGDVVLVLKPYYQLITRSTDYTTGHGTPHEYDTHVPLLVYGTGVRSGSRTQRVTPQAVVPILAQAMGVRPPPTAEATVPEGLFRAP